MCRFVITFLLVVLSAQALLAQTTDCLTAINSKVEPETKIKLILKNNLEISGWFSHLDSASSTLYLWIGDTLNTRSYELSSVREFKYTKPGKPKFLAVLGGVVIGGAAGGFLGATSAPPSKGIADMPGLDAGIAGALIGAVLGGGTVLLLSSSKTHTIECASGQ